MKTIRMQTEPKRTAIYVHVPTPERGLAVQGQDLLNLPGQRAGRVRVEEGGSRPVDPLGPDHGVPEPLGGRGIADAAVHRGQGCRALVIVALRAIGPDPTIDEDDMQRRRTEQWRKPGVGLAAGDAEIRSAWVSPPRRLPFRWMETCGRPGGSSRPCQNIEFRVVSRSRRLS